jgi:hypothetical protein
MTRNLQLLIVQRYSEQTVLCEAIDKRFQVNHDRLQSQE